jgi:hypothetical protein
VFALLADTSSLTVAIVGASAAVAGAVAGGAVTGVVTLRAEKRRQEFDSAQEERRHQREDDQEHALDVGTARTWRMRLFPTVNVLRASVVERNWLGVESFPPPPPLEDQKRIAAALSPKDWSRVQATEFALEVVSSRWRNKNALMEAGLEQGPLGLVFDDNDDELIRILWPRLTTGLDALAALAEMDPEDDPLKNVDLPPVGEVDNEDGDTALVQPPHGDPQSAEEGATSSEEGRG